MSLEAAPLDDALLRLDRRTRVLAALALVLTVASLQQMTSMVVAVALGAGIALGNRDTHHGLLHRLLHIEGFMIVLLVMLPLTVPGHPIVAVGPIEASVEGLHRAVAILLKVNSAALIIAGLIGTMEPVHFGHALARLGVPQSIVHLFLFSVRYVAVFGDEMRRLHEAMRARAFRPGSNFHTWRSYGNLAGMMLVRSLARAERVDEAMRARGYVGRLPLFFDGRFGRLDVGVGLLVFCAVAVLVSLDRMP